MAPAYQKSQSPVFMVPETGVPSAVMSRLRSWTGRVPHARSRGCKSSVAVYCWVFVAPRKSETRNASWPQRAPSAVSQRQLVVICQVERRLRGQSLVNQACQFELDTLSGGQLVEMEFALRVRYTAAWYEHGVAAACQWSVVQWRSAQTATDRVKVMVMSG